VAELERRGIKVNHLFLFDSHYVDAIPYESDDSLSNSANRLTQVMTQLDAKQRVKIFFKKIISFSKYRIVLLRRGIYKPLKMLSLIAAAKLNVLKYWTFPTPDVDTVLRRSEKKYRNSSIRPVINSDVVFFKAMQAQDDLEGIDQLEIDDTPYKHYFKGDVLGWEKIVAADKLTKIEVAAGHSTMLISRYVGPIAKVVNEKLSVVK
jgi:hypothetical protein